jgi:hypothetical protein
LPPDAAPPPTNVGLVLPMLELEAGVGPTPKHASRPPPPPVRLCMKGVALDVRSPPTQRLHAEEAADMFAFFGPLRSSVRVGGLTLALVDVQAQMSMSVCNYKR